MALFDTYQLEIIAMTQKIEKLETEVAAYKRAMIRMADGFPPCRGCELYREAKS